MTTFTLVFIAAAAVVAQHVDPAVCPLHAAHAKQQAAADKGHSHDAAVDARGTKAMGFDQSLASHHFTLSSRGGAIEIHVNDARDVETRQRVTSHLGDIRRQFAAGDFHIPTATHGEEPPGVKEMARLRDAIVYAYEPLPAGGRLNITARSPEALAAVHAFLRYQIKEHGTGDPVTVVR